MRERLERKTSIKTRKNATAAIRDESDDIGEYSKMAKQARKAGDKRAAKTFTSIGKDEREHRRRLKKLRARY